MFCITSAIAKPIQIELKDGTIWQGEIGQTITVIFNERGKRDEVHGQFTHSGSTYIQVHGVIIDLMTIVSISGGGVDNAVDDTPEVTQSNSTGPVAKPKPRQTPPSDKSETKMPTNFFILPMEKMVGAYFRPSELRELAEYLDTNYGPGQTIVLKVNSGGGYGHIWAALRDLIFEVRERHRVVAWIANNATSAAAMTIYCCDEIYYTSMGHVGSCTGYRGHPNNPLSPQEMQKMITEVELCIAQSSKSPKLAGCLFESRRMFSYTKDPTTGTIEYFDDMSGDVVLSDDTHNLNTGAKEALDAGLCDGIADTEAELAKLLDIEDWVELEDQYGIELWENWNKTMTNFEEEVWPDLIERFIQGQIEGKTQKQILSKQIKAGKELLRWVRKLGDTWTYEWGIINFPQAVGQQFATADEATDRIHRMIEELQHRLRLIVDE